MGTDPPGTPVVLPFTLFTDPRVDGGATQESEKETQRAVGTADMFTLSRQQQLGVFKDSDILDRQSGPLAKWAHRHTVLPRSTISLFTKQKL